MHGVSARRRAVVLAVVAAWSLTLTATVATPAAADSAVVPAGFRDELVVGGVYHPVALAYAPDGRIFVAEKPGRVQVFDGPGDTTPTLFANLETNVYNYWDRGLMGLALDPAFPIKPYVYVLYTYNHILGDPAPAPRWPSDPTTTWIDGCPDPPAPTTDGCVASSRLSRLTASGNVMTGSEKVLIEDWCQQFPSHTTGTVAFGPEGALYVSAGDGASFTSLDYGQKGGTRPDTTNPVIKANPCGDPPGPAGTVLTTPTAEGGSLRAQDLRTRGPNDPVSLDGTIIRVDPATAAGWPDNALHADPDANARRIVAYGFRNPFRFTFRPGTDDLWIGDVGNSSWEEIDELADPNAAAANYGWPCYEGMGPQVAYQDLGTNLCASLAPSAVTAPRFTYQHTAAVAAGDGCGFGSSAIAGITFLPASTGYPAPYADSLFFTDHERHCIWSVAAGADGKPDFSTVALFADLHRVAPDVTGGAVFLAADPNGDLVYADYDRGEIRRIHYYGPNVPPTASFTATPDFGGPPLQVTFDASGTSDPNGDPITYAWDLDGDGQFDDATGVTATWTYAVAGSVTVGLRATDSGNASDVAHQVVSVGNGPPVPVIDLPSSSIRWKVGDTIQFSGHATDPQDGALPASAFHWLLTMQHCPSDCHTHEITAFDGVTSGSFVAPEHDYPSFLRLRLTVTDSGGLSRSTSVDLQPQTGTTVLRSSPAGVPLSLGVGSPSPSPSLTAIVGATVSVAAPPTAAVMESTMTFRSWSDGGSATHDVVTSAGTTTLTASYDVTGHTDASNTCSGSPAPRPPDGRWWNGRFDRANDLDWFRFSVASQQRVQIDLGNLDANGSLQLYSGCGTLLQTSDVAGTSPEEIVRLLPAGSYAVRVAGSPGATAGRYVLRLRALPDSVSVLSARSIVRGATLRLVGEVYNNLASTRGPVSVTARLYDAQNHLLGTRTATTDLATLLPAHRSPFRIIGSLPAGFDHATYTVTAPATSASVAVPTISNVVSTASGAGRVVTGTATNGSSAVHDLAVVVTVYDRRLDVLDVAPAGEKTHVLAPGAATTFSGTFAVDPSPYERLTVGAIALR